MKKTLVFLTIAGLMLTSTVVFAHDDGGDGKTEVKSQAQFHANLEHGNKFGIFKHWDRNDNDNNDEDKFVIQGTVSAVGFSSLTVNVPENGTVVVAVDADTKFMINGKTQIRLADIKAGDKVVIKGEKEDNNTLEADHVIVVIRPQKAFGTVTAKTDTSLTIKNSVSGTEKTVTINPDTKVSVNGEVTTAADIQVGDKGVVKFKAALDAFVATMIRLFR